MGSSCTDLTDGPLAQVDAGDDAQLIQCRILLGSSDSLQWAGMGGKLTLDRQLRMAERFSVDRSHCADRQKVRSAEFEGTDCPREARTAWDGSQRSPRPR